MKNQQELTTKEARAEQVRKPYSPPQLIVYGMIEELTQGNCNLCSQDAGGMNGITTPSDRNLKEGFDAVDARDILSRVAALPIERWNYKAQGQAVRHIGPMAQDFYAAFNVGEDDRHINMVDANGVALASIQALYRIVEERNVQIEALKAEVNELKQRVASPDA